MGEDTSKANLKKGSREYLVESTKDRRFKPGQSGNPGGRPRTKHITRAYEKYLVSKAPEDIVAKLGLPAGSRWADVMAAGMIRTAVKGNVPAAKEVADRIEGPVNEAVEGSAQLNAIAISVRYENAPLAKSDEFDPPIITIETSGNNGNGHAHSD